MPKQPTETEPTLTDYIAWLHNQREALSERLHQETPTFAEYLDVETTLRMTEQHRDQVAQQQRRPGAWLAIAKQLMANVPGPTPLVAIHDALAREGLDINIRNLSSRLSNSNEFRAVDRDGWVLTERRPMPPVAAGQKGATDGDLFKDSAG